MKRTIKRHVRAKHFVLLGCMLLIVFFGASGTIAYITKQTDPVVNEFQAARIDGEIDEVFQNNVKSSVKVRNSGTADCYVRLVMVPYWINANQNNIGVDAWDLNAAITSDWFSVDEDGLTYYYYSKPVSPGKTTGELLQTPIELKPSEDGSLYQALDIFAECIQAKPEEAVAEAWKVTVAGDGSISK